MTASVLNIAGCNVAYGQIKALHDVEITVGPGEIIALVGANGAGKTTLMNAIIGHLPAVSGSIRLEGTEISRLSVHKRVRLGLGYSPEGRRIFPGLSVKENLDVASRESSLDSARTIDQVYHFFPDLAARQSSLGWTLSGGQQQMLAIGRALMMRPKLLLLDEPSLGLSPKLTNEVLTRLPEIVASGMAALIAEQNMLKALDISHRAYVLRNGSIVQSGESQVLKKDDNVRRAFLGGS
ncbi:ABC transporter ATP-binding protein [Bradyrhizobium sp. dw_78]|uniref:ABC transporter ATP-binding protein n=1 Tax=Bradyrhizobium sp. dw_78 TaxID=2719793 RepID=UPI001BD4D7CB|nr:ABC transporter ATP-binding protein [Bradyrhizobium sp. dw_78]